MKENPNISLAINNSEDVDMIYTIARALASKDRIHIMQLLTYSPLSPYELSKRLNLPISSVSNHLNILQEAHLININTKQGAKRHTKMCTRYAVAASFNFSGLSSSINANSYTVEMPIGQFTKADIHGPCGMIIYPSTNHITGETNTHGSCTLSDFNKWFDPLRVDARLIFFDYGYLTYSFPNNFYQNSVSQLELSFESCSEIAFYRNDWPSDITVNINGIHAITFLSPGDFGGVRGNFTPEYIPLNSTQYGLLRKILINRNGIFLDQKLITASKNISSFHITDNPSIEISIGVDENAVHRGGINLFGRNCGNFEQSIVLEVQSDSNNA